MAASISTVLVIEDDEILADLLRIVLEDDGCQVHIAPSAEAALALAHTVKPDLVTLDLALPDGDGHYVLDELRADARLQQVPVIVISGRSYRPAPGDRVIGVLPKPFDVMELDRLVQQTLAPLGLSMAG